MISRPPRDRPHPFRLAALVILFAGLVLMAVFAGGMVQGVQEQQALEEERGAHQAALGDLASMAQHLQGGILKVLRH